MLKGYLLLLPLSVLSVSFLKAHLRVFVLCHQEEWDAISKTNKNLLKAHCPDEHMVAADGFVLTGINVSQHSAVYFDTCSELVFFIFNFQLCFYDSAANLSTLTTLQSL